MDLHSVASPEKDVFELDNDKIVLFRLRQMLEEQETVNDEDLDENWPLLVPQGMSTSRDLLKGFVMEVPRRDANSQGSRWRLFAEEELSLEPRQRFRQLFEAKEEWST